MNYAVIILDSADDGRYLERIFYDETRVVFASRPRQEKALHYSAYPISIDKAGKSKEIREQKGKVKMPKKFARILQEEVF